MQQEAAKKVAQSLETYNKNKPAYENPATPADKKAAEREMINAARILSENYNASQMIDEKVILIKITIKKQCYNMQVQI